ncbi:UNVERIFIED_CONTAM: hypothetical protein NY603_33930, partial [Bacteroidetes bacterium 56_B9]
HVTILGDAPLTVGRRVRAGNMTRECCGPTTLLDGAVAEGMGHYGSGPVLIGGDAHNTEHTGSGFMTVLPGAELTDSS